ncbi:MAG: rhodanese-like domain-containing protein [Deltaproteobacteria bacterium]|nr:rhodanese-like domain-containing protein [Deltaproteobacteria bacterium]
MIYLERLWLGALARGTGSVHRKQVAAWVIGLLPLMAGLACAPAEDLHTLQQEIRQRYPEVSQISVEKLQAELSESAENIILLDAREAREFEVSHLPTARLATDLQMAKQQLAGLPSEGAPEDLGLKDRKIVIYCSVGYRSSALAQKLTEAGYGNVHNLEGSIFAWANGGLPVYREERGVQQVHPYDENWGRYLRRELWAW